MVDVVVTVAIFCSKVLVDHRRIVKRRNIFATVPLVLRTKKRHNSANSNDLACSERRVRLAGMFLVSLKVALKDVQRVLQSVQPTGVHTGSNVGKLFKVEKHDNSFRGGGVWRAKRDTLIPPLNVRLLL